VLIVGLLGVGLAAAWLGYRGAPPAVDLIATASPTPGVGDAPQPPATGPPRRPTGGAPGSAAAPRPLPRSAPVDLRIPAIGVRTGLVPLGLGPAGALQVPSDFALAGWYVLGPTPGEPGPAVIAGHVDSYRGPAVFFRLSALRPGDLVRVAERDGLVAVFRVYAVGRYPKTAFPTGQVYANTAAPELRLITCGGTFDRSVRSYTDNVVVYARLVAVESGGGRPPA
jgi:sortase (surface protein transpeptidase)